MSLEIGYWKIRGLGAPLRMILEHKGVDYKDVQFENPDDWFKNRKQEILKKHPLANLPYLIDGDVYVFHLNAIVKYLGKKFDLNGNDLWEQLWNAQLLGEIYDVRNDMVDLVYGFKNVNRTKAEFEESAAKLLDSPCFAKFENWLLKYDKEFFCSSQPCTADFHIWEMMDQYEMLAKTFQRDSPLANLPKCKAFYDRFKALPTLQGYFESESYHLPINNMNADAYFY